MNPLRAVVFLGLVFSLLAASLWYVAYRLRSLLGLRRRWAVRAGVAALVIGSVAAQVATANIPGTLADIVYIAGGYGFAFYVHLLLALLVLHAVQIFWNPYPAWSASAALVLALAVTGAGALRANTFVVTETGIPLPGLRRTVTVMLISDVHVGHHRGRAWLARIVAETNRRKPDLVLITGDLVDSRVGLAPGVLAPFSDLAAPAYFVGGNHELYVGAQEVFRQLAQQGVRVLHNEVVETHGLQLIGLDYMKADEDSLDMHPSGDRRTIKSVLAGLPLKRDLPSLLMHHSPIGTRYVAAKGIDLMVSGHTHGGQMFPWTVVVALVYPFSRGLHQEGKTWILVSQGAGTFMTRVRVGTSNEINLLRLTPGS